MRFAIDVAYCRPDAGGLRVIATATMRPWRAGYPRLRARGVIEAAAGAFDRWGLTTGDLLEIK
jgi:hypothetical protein